MTFPSAGALPREPQRSHACGHTKARPFAEGHNGGLVLSRCPQGLGGSIVTTHAAITLCIGVFCLVLVGAGCPTFSPVPEAAFACSERAPACPAASVCMLAIDGSEGQCLPLGSFDDVCTVVDGTRAGVTRPRPDGSPCQGSANDESVCIGSVCTLLSCGDARRTVVCGDGCREGNEVCDDGNRQSDDGCGEDCKEIETGFECTVEDDGPDICRTKCGDGKAAGLEECDDGNKNPVDGCHDDCTKTTLVSRLLVSGSVEGVVGSQMRLRNPLGIAGGPDGALYVADTRNFRVLRYDPKAVAAGALGDVPADTIVVAGGFAGVVDFSELDSRQRRIRATDARLCVPASVAVDPFGNLYIADFLAHRVYHVDRDGTIATVAGHTERNGGDDDCAASLGSHEDVEEGVSPDAPGPAEEALLDRPLSLAVDPATGDVFVLESGNRRVRRLRQRAGEDPRHPRHWDIETVIGKACPLDGGDITCEPPVSPPGGPPVNAPTNAADVRFGYGDFLGPGSLTLTPTGDVWVTDPFPLGKGRIVRVRAECLGSTAPASGLGTEGCVSFLRLPGLAPFPFGLHALDDGTVLATDVLSGTVYRLSDDGTATAVLRRSTPVLGADGNTPSGYESPVGVGAVGGRIYVADPNGGRVFEWSPGSAAMVQVMGLDGTAAPSADDEEEAYRLERPAQLAFAVPPRSTSVEASHPSGALFTIDTLGLTVHRFAASIEEPTDLRADIVLGRGRVDLFELLDDGQSDDDDGGGGAGSRPVNFGCVPVEDVGEGEGEGEALATFSFAQDEFTVGPEGVAVLLPGGDVEPVLIVSDSKARQILRIGKLDGRRKICDLSADLYPQGSTPDDNAQAGYEPGFLRAVATSTGFSLYVAEVWSPNRYAPERDPCFRGTEGCRLVRLELDGLGLRATGSTGSSHATPSKTPLGPSVKSIRDLQPLPDGTVLVADATSGNLYRVNETADGTALVETLTDPAPGAPTALQGPVGLALCANSDANHRVIVVDMDDATKHPRLVEIPLDGRSPWRTLMPPSVDGLPRGDLGPASQAGMVVHEFDETAIGTACANDGSFFLAERATEFAERGLGRIRRISPEGIVATFVGSTAPAGPSEDALRARLYPQSVFATLAPSLGSAAPAPGSDSVAPRSNVALPLAVVDGNQTGEAGRVLAVGGGVARAPAWVGLAAGYPRPFFGAPGPAREAPMLDGARGAAWNVDGDLLLVTQKTRQTMRVFLTTGAELEGWRDVGDEDLGAQATGLTALAADPTDGSFVVVDEDGDGGESGACLRRLSGDVGAFSLGACEVPPELAGWQPTQLAVSVGGVVYVSEASTGRVLRLMHGLGEGARVDIVYVAGANDDADSDDAPRRNQPHQLAFDTYGNLYVALSQKVIVVTDGNGDGEPDLLSDELDGDGNGGVGPVQALTAYGLRRDRYPENSSNCVEAVARFPSGLAVPAQVAAEGPTLDIPLIVAGDVCLRAAVAVGVDLAPSRAAPQRSP
jgi:cysteine-rich repeat protein